MSSDECWIAELLAENAKLRKALEFYAADDTWTERKIANGALGEFTTSFIIEDGGDVAKQALIGRFR
jgi:hypothetical protein